MVDIKYFYTERFRLINVSKKLFAFFIETLKAPVIANIYSIEQDFDGPFFIGTACTDNQLLLIVRVFAYSFN